MVFSDIGLVRVRTLGKQYLPSPVMGLSSSSSVRVWWLNGTACGLRIFIFAPEWTTALWKH